METFQRAYVTIHEIIKILPNCEQLLEVDYYHLVGINCRIRLRKWMREELKNTKWKIQNVKKLGSFVILLTFLILIFEKFLLK